MKLKNMALILCIVVLFLLMGCAAEKYRELRENIRADDINVRIVAAEELATMPGEESVRILIDAMKDEENKKVIQVFAKALVKIGKEDACKPTAEFMESVISDDITEYARSQAAWALGEMGDRKAITPLKHVLGDKSPIVKEQVEKALTKLGYY